jgi:hypothetical protein
MLTSCNYTIEVKNKTDYLIVTEIKQINKKNNRYEVKYTTNTGDHIDLIFTSYDFPVHSVGDTIWLNRK